MKWMNEMLNVTNAGTKNEKRKYRVKREIERKGERRRKNDCFMERERCVIFNISTNSFV